jgi:hypothetical protein
MIAALTTLKMAARVAETCRRTLCNTITFMEAKCICWLFNKILMQINYNLVISPHSLEILQNAARSRSLVRVNYPEYYFTGNMASAACDSRAAH